MPASRIDSSVRAFAPEPVLCWCNGQSLESRYSSSVAGGGAAATGRAIGNAMLRRKAGRARLINAVRMPRFPVVAAGASQILIFDGPIAKQGPFAALRRDQAEVIHGGGLMWRRLDLIVPADEGSRSYTMMVFGLGGGRKRLRRLVGELAGAGTGTASGASS